jgi:hypothetical protein
MADATFESEGKVPSSCDQRENKGAVFSKVCSLASLWGKVGSAAARCNQSGLPLSMGPPAINKGGKVSSSTHRVLSSITLIMTGCLKV